MIKFSKPLFGELGMSENQSKPLAYLDQNALDFILKNGKDGCYEFFRENLQVVYSDYTLREIYKAGKNANDDSKALEFINVLDKLKAQPIKLFQKEDGSYTIGRSPDILPLECYLYFVELELPFDKFLNPTILTNQAFYNGIKNYEAFGEEQKSNILEISNFLKDQLSEIENIKQNMIFENLWYNSKEIDIFINDYKQKIALLDKEIPAFNANVDFTNQIFEDMNAEKDINKAYQEYFNVDINNLKKINDFDLLPKIFQYIQQQNPEMNTNIDAFFNLGDELQVFQKVLIIYSHLNLLGYYQDKKLKDKDRFMSSWIDMNHASLACFCEFLITNDESFIKKAKVAYEYLKVMTQIYSIHADETGKTISLIKKYDILELV